MRNREEELISRIADSVKQKLIFMTKEIIMGATVDFYDERDYYGCNNINRRPFESTSDLPRIPGHILEFQART